MDLFISENGSVIQYAIIGIIIVTIVNVICINKWQNITPAYNSKISNSNSEYIKEIQNKKPIINADETICVEYGEKIFDASKYISAYDCRGKDITNTMQIYGKVDTNNRGVYKIKCRVFSEDNLMNSKYVNVIVE